LISVLIADDELLVRIGLKSSINWKEYGFLLVGEAKNAMEAYDIFIENRPDILITDITMPGQNGLELIHKLKDLKPDLASIVLTHHEDFNFAKEAISLGVVDYILKSNLTSDRLLKVLNKARKRIKKDDIRIQDGTESNRAFSNPDDSLKTLFKNFCTQPVAGNPSAEQIDMKYRNYKKILVSLKLHRGAENEDHYSVSDYDISSYQKVMDQLKSRFPPISSNYISLNRFYYIFLSNDNNEFTVIHERISKAFQMLGANLKTLSHDFVTIGLSHDLDRGTPVQTLFKQSVAAENRAFFQPNLIHVYTEDSYYRLIKKEEFYFNKSELESRLNASFSETIQYLDDLLDSLSLEQNYELLERFYSYIIETIRACSGTISIQDSFDKRLKSAISTFNSLDNLDSVRMHIKTLIETFNQFKVTQGNVETSFIIKKSKKFIETHYNQNITLSNLAQNVQVSNSYLSFLFKEELGINFTRYLTQVRIEKAKELLINTNLKIYEIAEKTGFDSPFYFSKVFKDITSLTCKEYRRNSYE